jgi:hypothetical protein
MHELEVVGNQLEASEVLQLLQQAADAGCSSAVEFFASLAAAEGMDDSEAFRAFVQQALRGGIDKVVMQDAVARLPVVKQLQLDAVLGIIRGCIDSSTCHPHTCMYDFVIYHPVLASVSTADAAQVLLQAAQQQRRVTVAGLLEAPAAQQLSVEVLADLPQYAVQEWDIWEASRSIWAWDAL